MAQSRIRRHAGSNRGRVAFAATIKAAESRGHPRQRGFTIEALRRGNSPALSQNATEIGGALRFGTRCERTAPESANWLRTRLFTARCRRRFDTAHHIQDYRL